jgi:hypothetical protein
MIAATSHDDIAFALERSRFAAPHAQRSELKASVNNDGMDSSCSFNGIVVPS